MVTPSSKNVGLHPSRPVFVAGVFRSGTSLLYSLLNQHPQMALMFECDVWDFPEAFSGLRFQRNWLERQEFYNQALSRHRLIFGGRLAGLEDTRTPEKLYRAFCEGKGARLWGEKSPFYASRLRQLARRYPGCAFVLLWRDPVEIYRSVVHAGRQERFFGRRGMLSRLIHCQEQMLQQSAWLTRAGCRIHHITYQDLIDRTEETCRGVCQFLEIEYDPRMLDLAHADLSAVYRTPQHEHLRRGQITRHKFSEPLAAATIGKLQRFHARWNRLSGELLGRKNGAPPAGREPSLFERLYHRISGSLLSAMDNGKRALFEFLPLPWLRTYRQTAQWLFARRHASPATPPSLRREISQHWITLAANFLVLAGLIVIHYFSNPRFTLLPFYLVPCAVLTLVINRRWGTFAALISSFVGPALLGRVDSDFASYWIFFWNWIMRFVLLEIVVLLLDRVRVEMNSGAPGHASTEKAESPGGNI